MKASLTQHAFRLTEEFIRENKQAAVREYSRGNYGNARRFLRINGNLLKLQERILQRARRLGISLAD